MSETPVRVEVVDRQPTAPLALVIKAMVVGFTFALVIPVALVLFFNHQDTARHLQENKELVAQNERLTKHLIQERIERQRVINEFIFDQCKKGERRDTVIVQQNISLIAILNRIPVGQRTLWLDRLVQSLQDTNRILEPPHEPSCVPPAAVTP